MAKRQVSSALSSRKRSVLHSQPNSIVLQSYNKQMKCRVIQGRFFLFGEVFVRIIYRTNTVKSHNEFSQQSFLKTQSFPTYVTSFKCYYYRSLFSQAVILLIKSYVICKMSSKKFRGEPIQKLDHLEYCFTKINKKTEKFQKLSLEFIQYSLINIFKTESHFQQKILKSSLQVKLITKLLSQRN